MKGYNQTNWKHHPARSIKGRRTNWGHRLSKFVSTEKGTPLWLRLLELKASWALDLQRFLASRGHPQTHKRGGACLAAPIRELLTSTILWSVACCTWSAPPTLASVRVLLLKFLSVNEVAGAWPRLLVSYWHGTILRSVASSTWSAPPAFVPARYPPRWLFVNPEWTTAFSTCLEIAWATTWRKQDTKVKKQSCKNRDNPLEDN